MKIEPRKESDRGGWLCMPLVASVPKKKDGKRCVARYAERFVGKDQRMQV